MGCAQSKIDNEESVSRCKERRNLMKDAVAARNAFAAGHTGYAMALKNTGAALSDYGHGEAEEGFDHALRSQAPLEAAPPPPPPPMDSLPPPPPPLPSFSPAPLQRATSMPEFPVQPRRPIAREESVAIAEEDEDEANEEEEEEEEEEAEKMQNVRRPPPPRPRTSNAAVAPSVSAPVSNHVPPMPESKGMAWDYFFNVDPMPGPSLNDEEEINNDNDESEGMGFGQMGNGLDGNGVTEVEPKTPEKVLDPKVVAEEDESSVKEVGSKQIEHSSAAPAEFSRKGGKAGNGVSLMKVLNEIDDQFLKASESAQEVSKMLEATRLHYHSNFADARSNFMSLSLLLYICLCIWVYLQNFWVED